MPGAGVDDIRVRGVHRQRLHFMNLPALRRSDQGPGGARIGGAEDPVESSRKERPGMGGRRRESANRLSAQCLNLRPAPSAVVTQPQPAAGVVRLPSGHIQGGRVHGVNSDVIDNQAVGGVQFGEAMPGSASIHGFVDPTVGGAQIEMTGLSGNRSDGARVASSRANRVPGCLGRRRRNPMYTEKYNRNLHDSSSAERQLKPVSRTIHAGKKLPTIMRQVYKDTRFPILDELLYLRRGQVTAIPCASS